MSRQADPPMAPHRSTLIFSCLSPYARETLSALRGTYSTILHCLVSARAVVQISALRFLLQDAVWEKLDTIDGNTVYVGSRINQPGEHYRKLSNLLSVPICASEGLLGYALLSS